MKTKTAAPCGLLTLLLAFGCSTRESDPQAPAQGGLPSAKAGVIGLSVLTDTNPFFQIIAKTMEAEAAKHGFEVHATSGEFDAVRQKDQVSDFIVNQVSAIVLTPCQSKAVGTAIAEANRAGIPVFTADIACLAPGVEVVCHVATDNYAGGRLAADAIIEVLGGSGKVAIVDHPEVESVILRTKGFRDRLREARERDGVRIEIVATVPGGGVEDQSFRSAEDVLQAHEDLDAIFAINDPSALGALAAVEKAQRANRIAIVGFDGETAACRAIKEGKIYADVVQHPAEIARKTVDVVVRYLNGEEVPPQVLIPVTLYRKADALDDPRLK